jgi:hypothetical protein
MSSELGLSRAARERSFDYAAPGGRVICEARFGRQGVRDVRDGLLQLASYVNQAATNVDRAYLAISLHRSSRSRVLEVWKEGKRVMRPEVARKLYLLAAVEGQGVVEPHDPELEAKANRFARVAAEVEGGRGGPQPSQSAASQITGARTVAGSWKHLEVEKVLLRRWLLGEGPIQIGDLSRQVGCSYPTASQALGRLARGGLLQRRRARSVEIVKYPRATWAELFMRARSVYAPLEFVDVTGQPGAAERLIRRLGRKPAEDVALGGVAAGRRWDPDFDLNGTPRVDVVLHAQGRSVAGGGALELVKRLDPALKPVGEERGGSPVLAVHPLARRDPLFDKSPGEPLPWADPVETIIHLNEMGLTAQAGKLLSRLRPEARL